MVGFLGAAGAGTIEVRVLVVQQVCGEDGREAWRPEEEGEEEATETVLQADTMRRVAQGHMRAAEMEARRETIVGSRESRREWDGGGEEEEVQSRHFLSEVTTTTPTTTNR